MCTHRTPQEAARCVCTGYGFGDITCRCGRPRSQHEDGTGQCVIESARCHEFVVGYSDPLSVPPEVFLSAVNEVLTLTGLNRDTAAVVVLTTLTALRRGVMERDWELKSTRSRLDRMTTKIAQLEQELNHERNQGDHV